MTLQEVLLKFTNDTSWNTNGRFTKEIKWIEDKVNEYALTFNKTPDEIITQMEKERDISWPNYYQEANFPSVTNDKILIGVFNTVQEFYAKHNKFVCPQCKTETPDPQNCIYRETNPKKCNWCSYGLFSGPKRVIILETGFKAIPIFKPTNYEEDIPVEKVSKTKRQRRSH